MASVAHSLPVAYLLGAVEGMTPRPRTRWSSYATPHRVHDRGAVEEAVALLDWLAHRARLVSATLPAVDLLARIESTSDANG